MPAAKTGRPIFWTPRDFAPTERVKIRVSGECPLVGDQKHLGAEDGRVGTVIRRRIPRDPALAGHTVAVAFDEPIHVGPGDEVWGGFYAPAELSPIEEGTHK